MNASCPTCKAKIAVHSPPPSRDPTEPNEAWLCNMGCDVTICVACYARHNEKAHSEIYKL